MLGITSPIHWVILLVAAAVLFGGRGKLSSIMGDAANGLRAFKVGLKAESHDEVVPQLAAPGAAHGVEGGGD
jgi:sec-independent protein translocase protein TatA